MVFPGIERYGGIVNPRHGMEGASIEDQAVEDGTKFGLCLAERLRLGGLICAAAYSTSASATV